MKKSEITPELVARLVGAQFPHWAGLPVRPVGADGWDNATFRLGERMAVRLPSAGRYAAQVAKEQRWLPILAPQLPLEIPDPLAQGEPALGYPWPWSVVRWIEGECPTAENVSDRESFAAALAEFLIALHRVDAAGGPPAGAHSFFRGGPLETYDAETRRAIGALRDQIDANAATAVWQAALDAHWRGAPVWVHGDFAAGNLLVRGGRLCAVIDFGCAAVGDPACDTVIEWTSLTGASREVFRSRLPLDDATWARGRGWALWKALITLAAPAHAPRDERRARAVARDVIDAVIREHSRG